jgi:YfiR/HmsC-like
MAGAFVSERRSITKRLILLAALLFGVRAEAQAPMDESQVKAMFVYNFLKFVEWPSESIRTKDPFVVLIIGDGPTADATERFLESKTIGERPLFVRRTKWDQSLAGARALFVVEHDPKKLRRILDAAAAAGVLTIGEGESFATQGGVIGLLVENRKVRFDVDTTAAQVAGLRVSSKLLALTRVVRSSTDRSGSQQ